MATSVWRRLDPGETRLIGALALRVERDGTRLSVLVGRADFERQRAMELAPELDGPVGLREIWRGHLGDVPIRIQPAMPDRPVILRAEPPIHLTPSGSRRLYARLPVSVAILIDSAPPKPLLEVPTQPMAPAAFGRPVDAILGYWAPEPLLQTIPETRADVAIVPVQIRDVGERVIELSRWLLDADGIALWDDGRALWSDPVEDIVGNDGRLEIENGPPREVENARLIVPARNPLRRGFADWAALEWRTRGANRK